MIRTIEYTKDKARTIDFSKAKLSVLLKEMEGRKLIKKDPEGKTFRVYLRK